MLHSKAIPLNKVGTPLNNRAVILLNKVDILDNNILPLSKVDILLLVNIHLLQMRQGTPGNTALNKCKVSSRRDTL